LFHATMKLCHDKAPRPMKLENQHMNLNFQKSL